jgi:RNA polymerase sigma-70 factor (ECF subfamily)
LRVLGNREDAAEVTQEAFLRTFWKITGFHGHAHFYTWLYRITLNLCYRRLEVRKREPQLLAPNPANGHADEVPSPEELLMDPSDSACDVAGQQESIQLVRQALAALKPRDFHILILREFEHLSYDELAERLHLAKGTVMSRLHRARLALAEQLTRLGIHQ